MRFCTYCDETLWPDLPEGAVVKGTDPYCSERCYQRDRYEQRRENAEREPYYRHDCSHCGRYMFAPVQIDGWFCPECDHTEEIDTSYWKWHCQNTAYSRHEFEHDCPNCESWLWLFDGALRCHDCDVWITQYRNEWWALLEQEYPSKTTELMEQTEL